MSNMLDKSANGCTSVRKTRFSPVLGSIVSASRGADCTQRLDDAFRRCRARVHSLEISAQVSEFVYQVQLVGPIDKIRGDPDLSPSHY